MIAAHHNGKPEQLSQHAGLSLTRGPGLGIHSPSRGREMARGRKRNTALQLVCGIGAEDVLTGKPSSRLIYPLSNFAIAWVATTAFFLLYTATVTPLVISFFWLDPECTFVPTLYFDVILDVFFLLDIVVSFNLGFFDLAGDYVDDRRKVAVAYIKGSFFFDLVTSFPVSFFELSASAACADLAGGDTVDTGSQLRMIRVIKPLRWFKIMRIAKLGKGESLVTVVMDYWNISPKQGKAMKILLQLMLVIHILSCLWWLWKVLGMAENEVGDFLDAQAWGQYERNDLITIRGKIEAYVISAYVVTMTLTTVGYGDISADNTSERVGYIIFFITGAFVWGDLLAQACLCLCVSVCVCACMRA